MNENKIREIITQSALSLIPDEDVWFFLQAFKEKFGDNLEGLIFYGSCLTSKMRKQSSIMDFFVLLREYTPAARDWLDRILLPIMPPNSYSMKINNGSRSIECKYLLLTLGDFNRLCTHHASDHFVAGRMCKRSAIVWSKDNNSLNSMFNAIVDAFYTNAFLSVPLIIEPVELKGFIISILKTSYLSEIRLELPDKIEQIYLAEKELYDKLYSMLTEDLIENGMLTKKNGQYRSSVGGSWQARKTKMYLWKCKARHILRFPKMFRNVENWFDLLNGKYERTYGAKIEYSDWERRHQVITGFKYLYKIKIAKSSPGQKK